jgi:phospholipid-binding lipoprotein MlaA
MKHTVAAAVLAVLIALPVAHAETSDPLEPINRGIYGFNDAVDRAVLRPVAKGYEKAVPSPVRSCITNFFANLGDIWSSINSFLQGNAHQGINSAGRVMLNSTLGVFGCFDLATGQGVPRVREDFGQTLAVWGVGPGPYLVLPLLGPSTLRDTIALPIDMAADPIGTIDHTRTRNATRALDIIDTRANLLPASKLVDDVALDPYSFVRDGYLQRRQDLIFNGNPPPAPRDDE